MSEEMMPDMLAKAEDGDAQAQYRLGIIRENEKNYLGAAKWFRLAAAQGHSGAQFKLGFLYVNGHLEPDDAKAVEFFRLAAEQGVAEAQNNLAFMFENGRGVAKDLKKAEYWYKQSAEQGNERAKNNLVRLNDPKLKPLTCPFCHFESERGAEVCKGCQATIRYPTNKVFWLGLLRKLIGAFGIGILASLVSTIFSHYPRGYDYSLDIFIIVTILVSGIVIVHHRAKLSEMREKGKVVFTRRMH